MTIRAITAVLTIAGTTFVLTGCNEAERQGTASLLSSLNINDPVANLSSPAPAVAYVTDVVPEAPKVAWEEVPEPLPPPCENYVWRAVIYTCNGVAIGTVD